MRILLRAEFPNGHFGDPALYVWRINGREAMLFDCGDLSRLTTRQLFKVDSIFLSHCHIDHFFGFDLFLRVHVGSERRITLFGPPETSERVGGKLQGYTWNLIRDQSLEFRVIDLDAQAGRRTLTRFHAANAFLPSDRKEEDWDPRSAILDAGTYSVFTRVLDHRTPSMAYLIEEKPAVLVDAEAIQSLRLKTGPWINDLKNFFLFGGLESQKMTIEGRVFEVGELASKVLIPQQRHRIAYVTDGSASLENRGPLLELVRGADVLYCETCFLERDREPADSTKHFTAQFIGGLAREAGVKKLVPLHFSKRYLECADEVIREVKATFGGEVQVLVPKPRVERL